MKDLIAWLDTQISEDGRAGDAIDEYDLSQIENRTNPRTRQYVEDRRAEIEAKRQLLDWAATWLRRGCAPWSADALRILAQPYAGRPGWREEWRT